jgi:hypothetical protein
MEIDVELEAAKRRVFDYIDRMVDKQQLRNLEKDLGIIFISTETKHGRFTYTKPNHLIFKYE